MVLEWEIDLLVCGSVVLIQVEKIYGVVGLHDEREKFCGLVINVDVTVVLYINCVWALHFLFFMKLKK